MTLLLITICVAALAIGWAILKFFFALKMAIFTATFTGLVALVIISGIMFKKVFIDSETTEQAIERVKLEAGQDCGVKKVFVVRIQKEKHKIVYRCGKQGDIQKLEY